MPLLPSQTGPLALRVGLTLSLAALLALACESLGTPLPWMIGPLVGTAVACMLGLPLASAGPLRNAGQWAIGAALGLYFTPQVVGIVASHAGAIVAGIVWALAIGMAFGVFLRYSNPHIAGLDRATTFFSSAIGGASEMAVLADRHGGRVDLVASAHSVRIMIVVLTIPFGFQFAGVHGLDPFIPGPARVSPTGLLGLIAVTGAVSLLLQKLNKPNPWVLGSLAAAATLTASGVELSALPRWMTNLGQLFIGVALGTRFTPAFVHTAPRWLFTVAAGTLATIVASAGFAWCLARWAGLHPATVLLGTSPGGIAEMCITAKVLQLGVPIVTAFHVTRMTAVVLLAGPLFRWSEGRRAAVRPGR
ncbi:AbrB family transcriptional regulator [Aquabacterium sp. A7-Y]|uniref:AbrB family transcriptional regulator n=1 Tax=Aquabacterium sp. A7-Y TaxID=1349605 RepID=UPI00223E0D85|nr:AbrB family transcriptional regulator [Aquabacterium sp. A7-Y]MCW7538318.1 AbrB family transcriptional regulator [Aquabacterium sp. A7-Y]